jgi:A/G-specific adenine glycosylase
MSAGAEGAELRRRLLRWYRANGRYLAFRGTSDPWAILVSEVMAQQTQAARAAEAWTAFMAAYPTPGSLAAASPAAALRAWRGLGYNRRAIALQRAAQQIVERHDGLVPSGLADLEALPGVGPYTARAVAALAFGRRVGAVDTNVRRVLTRVFLGTRGAPDAAAVQALADELVPARAPGTWTHAVMDIGATFCRSRNPLCDECPARPVCRYAAARRGPASGTAPARGRGAVLPGAAARFPSTTRWLRGRILDRLRDAGDGTWTTFDAPIGEHSVAATTSALAAMSREGLIELRVGGAPEARLPQA